MKNIFLLLGLLCTSSLFAQFTYNDGGLGGIQSPNTSATGIVSFSAGYLTLASGDLVQQLWVHRQKHLV